MTASSSIRSILYICFYILLRVGSSSAGTNCSPLPYASLPNGRIIFADLGKFRFQCETGYFLSGPRQIKCKNGNWTSTKAPVCFKGAGRCEPPVQIPNADMFGEDLKIGSVIQYICRPGYLILGDGQRICLRSGYWGGITPSCISESEPLKDVAQRMEKQFVTKMSSHSGNVAQARHLDDVSLSNGLELVILVDRSSSVDPVDLEKAKDFIKFLFEKLKVKNGINPNGTRAVVIAFGSEVEVLFNLDNANISNWQVAGEILDKKLKPLGGGTAMNPALITIFSKVGRLLRKDAKRAIFLMSDGEPNIGGTDVDQAASALKKVDNFEIFAIGIGRDINRQTLSSVVSEPIIDHVFLLEKYENLEEIMAIIKHDEKKVPPPPAHKCGHPSKNNRWPWNAAIYIPEFDSTNKTGNLKLCGGALICSEWVISAATCFYVKTDNGNETKIINPEKISIILGEKDLLITEPNEMSFYAKDIYIHPKFNISKSLFNNLAIIRLNEKAPVKEFRPICLPPTSSHIPLHLIPNVNASIRGWGLSEPKSGVENITPETTRFSYKMKSVMLTVDTECNRITRKKIEGKSIICASSGNETCLGNVGTPLAAKDPQSQIQHLLGILSQKNGCMKRFSQYTELVKFVPWINDVTNKCHFKHWNEN